MSGFGAARPGAGSLESKLENMKAMKAAKEAKATTTGTVRARAANALLLLAKKTLTAAERREVNEAMREITAANAALKAALKAKARLKR